MWALAQTHMANVKIVVLREDFIKFEICGRWPGPMNRILKLLPRLKLHHERVVWALAQAHMANVGIAVLHEACFKE